MILVFLILSGGRVGGAERQALLLAKHGRQYGLDCKIITVLADDSPALAAYRGSILQAAEQAGISVDRLNARGVFDVSAFRRFYRLVRKSAPSVVYTYGLRADLIARSTSRLAGCPLVISSIRGMEDQRRPHEIWLDRLTSPLVRRWISNSQAGKQRFVEREKLPAAKIVVIPNGIEPVDPPISTQRFRQQWGVTDDHLVIGTTASLCPPKGHMDILECTPLVLQAVPEARFVFIGDGPLRADLQQRIHSSGLDGYVTLAGHSDEVYQALAEIDLFLLASHYEGMPNALMEAMMAERCCIATDVGDISTILDNGTCGRLVPAHQPEQLAKAIIDLAQNPHSARQLAAAARHRILNTYSPHQLAQQVSSLFQTLL